MKTIESNIPNSGLFTLITSSSRLELLKRSISSFLDKKDSTEVNLVLHEDFVLPKESDKVIDWAIDSKLFCAIFASEPRTGVGKIIYNMLPYMYNGVFLRLEDDWLFPQPILLGEMLSVFEKNHTVNQINFNQAPNEPTKHDVIRPEIVVNGNKLTWCQEWGIGPGLWRNSFLIDKWEYWDDAHSINGKLGVTTNWMDVDWSMQTVGSYFWGGHNFPTMIEHIGGQNPMWYRNMESR